MLHMLRQKECVKTIVSTFLCTFCILNTFVSNSMRPKISNFKLLHNALTEFYSKEGKDTYL